MRMIPHVISTAYNRFIMLLRLESMDKFRDIIMAI